MDARSQIKTYIAILIAGFGLLGIGQMILMKNYPDIFIFISILFVPLYTIWLAKGANFVTQKVLQSNNNKKQ
jgi:hypothetical protein